MQGIYEETSTESFRDSVSTIGDDGKRVWIYPKKPKGRFYNRRSVVSYLLLAILVAVPFIKIGGQPLLLLDVLNRKFVIFGQIFWPQDSHLFALGFISIVLFVILFTVVYGRLFCGWICPQTIFMEMVFRKIEYAIEGDWKKQQKLNKMPWNGEKVRKKALKHSLFFMIAFFIANTFLAYLIGIEALQDTVTKSPTANPGTFTAIMVFSVMFYIVFAKLREQVCTTICPYGRLQGVLLDKSSVVVAYDYVRGESRGRYRKKEDRAALGKGDCVDCHQCVNVCPTGIDIRNGTQLECINCTACMDACDSVMDKLSKPRGLIRYASEENIAQKTPFKMTARSYGYTAVLSLLVVFVSVLLITRSEVETTILRTPGMMYQDQGEGKISNLYNLKLINKTNNSMPLELRLMDKHLEAEIKMVGNDLLLEEQGAIEQAMFVVIDKNKLTKLKTSIDIGVYSDDRLIEKVSTNFMGPAK